MHALQPSPPSLQPVRRSRKASHPRKQRHSQRAIALEAGVKLTVNVVLSMAAITALTHLLPYRTAQEAKLQEVQAAAKSTNDRLQRTQSLFSRYFDPYQARAIMQEQANRIDPNQRQVILDDPKSSNLGR